MGGTLSVIECPNELPQKTLQLVQGLIREMYANLVKHASPDSPYEVFVLLHESSIEITQINRIRCDGQAPVRSDGGHGVAFYADRISDLGGVLTSENLDDDWNMYARIPVKATK